VPSNRYALVTASAVPATGVAGADLQFRTDANGGWYAIAMTNVGGTWSARLPRPTPSLESFEYRIVWTSATTDATAGPGIRVRVGAAAECEAPGAQPSIAAPVVVKVPEGAPVAPPVPGGFSPAGVVGARPPAKPRFTAGTIARDAGIVLAGVAVAKGIASTGSSETELERDIPLFAFNGTSPPAGGVLSLSRGHLVVFVVMDHEPRRPLTLQWRVELLPSPIGAACVVMQSVFSGAQRPVGLALTAPLAATGACGERSAITNLRIIIRAPQPVYEDVHAVSFQMEP
jgi:hypothetical protein